MIHSVARETRPYIPRNIQDIRLYKFIIEKVDHLLVSLQLKLYMSGQLHRSTKFTSSMIQATTA